MLFDIVITAGALFPFYIGIIVVLSKEYEKRLSKIFRLFLLSTLATAPFFLLKYLDFDSSFFADFFGPLVAIVMLAALEELFKSLFLLLDKEFSASYIYPIVIGIGFAFFENISYLSGMSFSAAFILIAILRLFMDSTAHAVFTCTVAHFMHLGRRKAKTFYFVIGLLVSGSLHGLFNLLHHWDMNYLAIPLLVSIIYYLHVSSDYQISHAHTHHQTSRTHHPLISKFMHILRGMPS